MRKVFLVVCVLFTFIAFNSGALAADTIKWKAQAFWSAGEIPYKTFAAFCEKLNTLTDGRLEITPHPGGSITPVFEMLEALENNVIQVMHSAPTYWAGKNPAFAAIGELPASFTKPWMADYWFHEKGGMDFLTELYRPFNAVPAGIMFWGVESMPAKKPLDSIDDFKGLKMRTPPGMSAKYFQKLGASVVVLPGGEVFSALDKGVIEATDWGTPSMNYRMGYSQIAKYFNYPGFHSMPAGDFVVNQDEWNKLPDDIKAIIKTASREWTWSTIEKVAAEDVAAVEKMKEEGVTPVKWSTEELKKARNAAVEIWNEWAKKNEMSKNIVESKISLLKELGAID
mgnify:CR=1 FL=1